MLISGYITEEHHGSVCYYYRFSFMQLRCLFVCASPSVWMLERWTNRLFLTNVCDSFTDSKKKDGERWREGNEGSTVKCVWERRERLFVSSKWQRGAAEKTVNRERGEWMNGSTCVCVHKNRQSDCKYSERVMEAAKADVERDRRKKRELKGN